MIFNSDAEDFFHEKVNEARNTFELQRASVGADISLSQWIEDALREAYLKGIEEANFNLS